MKASRYSPAMTIFEIRNVGEAVELFNSKSFAIASIDFSIVSRLEEIVISPTGNWIFPSSIQNPEAPREKSPVTELNPNPIISVTYNPFAVDCTRSPRDCSPGASMKLLVVELMLPPLRPALAVGSSCSFRAL